ncbi:hypothetical protein [Streptomyces sp.]|uniref:hypothetical protein n=1 Tax=Streptomyces sp. TaxID=1931 RepID=UPI002F957EF8
MDTSWGEECASRGIKIVALPAPDRKNHAIGRFGAIGDVSRHGGLHGLGLAVALILILLIVQALTVRGALPGSAATPASGTHGIRPESSDRVLLKIGDTVFLVSGVLSRLGNERSRY